MTSKENDPGSERPRTNRAAMTIVLVVVAIFAGTLLAKSLSNPAADSQAAGPAAAGGTITSTHNDAVADYEAALKTGKPVYVLFHSLTCQPCVEISAVVDKVMPEYEGKVVFVNAISDDPSGQRLASRFQFQYIPTSFFIDPDGAVVDSFTGAMSEAEMKSRLDRLVAQ